MRITASAALVLALAVSALAAPPVPRKSPEFTITEPSGKQILLSSLKGKVVVFTFMYTTCPHCQREAQMVTKLYKELGPKGMEAVGVAFNDANGPLVAQFVKEFNVGYPVGYATREAVQSYLGISVMDRYVVPQIAVIDRKGMIVEQSDALQGTPALQDENSLRQIVMKHLGAATSPTTTSSAKKPASATKSN